ncbi:hypothetical protein OG689_36960 [Kitasatospora sp. NBC_00240]|uniref:hypothetical protein n=1 Tax=Kitasatospora sp. NBC_00240 TaxID=2903567 RepID=UPI00224D3E2F|nr:hypothetical protein [Kitasatospora sp. NBC_00240]MCX5214787.1 hypothetical protein [Kitasatospora sp. NBC_00240]
MTAQYRAVAWAGATLGALAAVGLAVYVMVGDLGTADRVASVLGAVVGLAALAASLYSLRAPATPPALAAGAVTVRIRRSVSAVSAGRSSRGSRGRPVRADDEEPSAPAGRTP